MTSSLWMRRWGHIRTIEPIVGGCTVHDRVEFTPRVPLVGTLLAPVYRAIFRRRHHVLRNRFTARAAIC